MFSTLLESFSGNFFTSWIRIQDASHNGDQDPHQKFKGVNFTNFPYRYIAKNMIADRCVK